MAGPEEEDSASEPNEAGREVDARADRAVEGAIAIALLAAFVFRQPLVVPVVGVLAAAGAVGGVRAHPLHLVFARVTAGRLPPARTFEPEADVQAQAITAVVLLALASLAFLAGVSVVGWLLALIEAAVATLAATTGLHVAAVARDRLRRR